MNKKITIREAKTQDVPKLLELVRELAVYENAPEEVSNTTEMMIEDGFGMRPLFDAFVVEQGSDIIGMAITYYRYSTWKGKCLYLEDLIISDKHRGKGVGKQLFNHCVDFGKMNKCKRMVWQVLDWNEPAIRFYKTYGASLDGEWVNGSLEL